MKLVRPRLKALHRKTCVCWLQFALLSPPQVLAGFQTGVPQRGRRHHQVVLGAGLTNPLSSNAQKLAQHLHDATRTLNVTLLVFISHVDWFYPNSIPGLPPVGPNPYEKTRTPKRTMKQISEDIESNPQNYTSYVCLSISMGVFGYTMEVGWLPDQRAGMTNAHRNATDVSMYYYSQACASSVLDYGLGDFQDIQVRMKARTADRYLVLYDDAGTVTYKTNATWHTVKGKAPKYGIAVYRLENEDYNNGCKEGMFPRLVAIRDSIRDNFK